MLSGMLLKVTKTHSESSSYLRPNWIFFYFSEVELGEHDIEADPDCKSCAKRITMKITDPKKQIITHKGFDQSGQNDIALIRFNEPIPLFR